ncbi:MAG: helix-turn-helix transcriptional regulator [Alphaproteobacteria bacterium]|nr:helix-turn-helix transcriptional regulator [Alphaproteobacteria bacterium]
MIARAAENLRPDPEADELRYLRQLGERVRNGRARRGMTRRQLALHSGVSERYLAQLESGQGNISIMLLRQVAAAMGLAPESLVRDGAEPPVELALLLEKLNRLSPRQIERAAALIEREFGGRPERQGRIALIGLRGAGKTTLGQLLAARLSVPFVDLAKLIEAEAGAGLSEIFNLYGQGAYRRYERQALERALAEHPAAVIEAGGSLVSETATYERLLDSCFTIWIKASLEEHMNRVIAQGDLRPMAGDRAEAMADLRRILAQREALYAKAHATLDTSDRPEAAALDDLLQLAEFPEEPR